MSLAPELLIRFQRYTVIYELPMSSGEAIPTWRFFECDAESADVAEELCREAVPWAEVLWVNEGMNREMWTWEEEDMR